MYHIMLARKEVEVEMVRILDVSPGLTRIRSSCAMACISVFLNVVINDGN